MKHVPGYLLFIQKASNKEGQGLLILVGTVDQCDERHLSLIKFPLWKDTY